MKKTTIVFKSVFAISFLLCSCGNNENKETESGDTATTAVADTTPVNELANFRFTYAIANLPSPLQVLDEFSKSNLPTDIGLLNPTENAEKYHSSFKHALNYGIYGVDMGYLVVNNRTLESIKYYSISKKLAEQLNMSETFNKFVNRFENNSNNKDSLLRVIDEAYSATDSYLHSNERLETASEILAGSWIECQHLTVNLLKNADRNADNEKLYDRIYEQRLHLDNITKVLDEFKNDTELMKIKKDFENLLSIYKELNSSQDVTKGFLAKLSISLEKVRNNIIS